MKRLHVVALAAVIAFTLSTAVPAQNANEIIKSTSNGLFWFGGNEARSDAKDLDASKVRVGSRMVPGQHGGGGAFTFDGLMTTDTSDTGIQRARRVEVAGIGGSFNGRTGEVGMWIWNGRDPNDIRDADQVKVIEFFSDHIEIKVPVKGLSSVSSGRVTRFYTDGGKYIVNWQDDTGKPSGIIYDTHGTTNEAEWTAVGRIPIEYF
jgi:hypothetical protein